MTEKDPEIYISTGSFYLWNKPVQEYAESVLMKPAVKGIQILFDMQSEDCNLLPADVISYLKSCCLSIVLHPTFDSMDLPPSARQTEKRIAEFAGWMSDTGITDIILHADHFMKDSTGLGKILRMLPGARIFAENMGRLSGSGKDWDSMSWILEQDPSRGFVMDIAHVQEMDSPLDQPQTWLEHPVLSQRLSFSHISLSGLVEQSSMRRSTPSSLKGMHHWPSFLNPLFPSAPEKKILSGFPMIIEGCLPPPPAGIEWLEEEIDYLTSWSCA